MLHNEIYFVKIGSSSILLLFFVCAKNEIHSLHVIKILFM